MDRLERLRLEEEHRKAVTEKVVNIARGFSKAVEERQMVKKDVLKYQNKIARQESIKKRETEILKEKLRKQASGLHNVSSRLSSGRTPGVKFRVGGFQKPRIL